jgi:hypothetical protein
LYAGTAWYESEEIHVGRLYRYEGDTNSWELVSGCDSLGFGGFRSLYVRNDILHIGDLDGDKLGHYDGNEFTFDTDLEGSCIWDFEAYDSNLYASAYIRKNTQVSERNHMDYDT